jgi:prepilin peptidase CpaA
MLDPIPVAMGSAVTIAVAAAVSDSRSGMIPNWITLPPLLVAPFAYAAALELAYGVQSVASGLASGVAPYLMFRRGAMGGGDVKLFAAIGALAGFDPLIGVQVQLTAFSVAMFAALCRQAWRGKLLTTLASAAALPLNTVLPVRYQLRVSDQLRTTVRMGGAILLATVASALPYFARVSVGAS